MPRASEATPWVIVSKHIYAQGKRSDALGYRQ